MAAPLWLQRMALLELREAISAAWSGFVVALLNAWLQFSAMVVTLLT
jgi:hypothetical protein